MRHLIRTVLAAAVATTALASAAVSAQQVEVSYVKPEQFSDVPFMQVDRERLLKDLTAHFSELGHKLPAGQTLKIEVLDVDLAGRVYPRRAADDIRIMRGAADWPHMHLRYSLEENGQVLRSGDDEISNMAYQDRINHYSNSDALRYEKQMMDDWFEKQFGAKRHS